MYRSGNAASGGTGLPLISLVCVDTTAPPLSPPSRTVSISTYTHVGTHTTLVQTIVCSLYTLRNAV